MLNVEQSRVMAWVDRTFPALPGVAEENAVRVRRVLEEVVELTIACGTDLEEVWRLVETVWERDRQKLDSPQEIAGEAADVLLCLYALCDRRGIDLQRAAQVRMDRNLARSPEYYAAKQAAKRAAGL